MTHDDPNILTDGFTTLERGMDSGKDAALISRNQMALGVNTTIRGGFPTHRPGYRKLPLDVQVPEATRWTKGRWQGAKYFKPLSDINGKTAPERIVCSVGGRQFAFVPDQLGGSRGVVQEITPTAPETATIKVGFTVPAVGGTVQVVCLPTTIFLSANEVIVIEGGTYSVVSVDTEILVTIKNLTGVPGSVVSNSAVVVCEPHGDRNNAYRWTVWMEQAEDFMIIQDGQATPIIYNGSVARRATANEVPTGTVMAYGLGRLWVARGREFIASDIVGGPSGTSLYAKRDAILHFTENEYIAEGGAFLVADDVTGMEFPANIDTALGQGELVVFMKTGAATVKVPPSREEWKNLSIPLQRVSLRPFGAMGQNGIVMVNGDLWFRAKDGIRSYVMAQRMYGDAGNVPMSREMNAVISADDERLLPNTTGALFDNRLLMSCVGQREYDHGHHFKALVALDFEPASSMRERLPPAYDGVWTGLDVHQVVSGDFDGITRCFLFVRNKDRDLEIWEVTRKDTADRPNYNVERRIKWEVYPRSFTFQDEADGLKLLTSGRIWRDQIKGDVSVCVQYRPDQYPIWQDWHCTDTRAAKEWCAGAPNAGCIPQVPLPQYRTNLRLPQLLMPKDEVTDGKPMNHGHEFKVRVIVKGSCRLRRMRVKAQVVQEELDHGCTPDEQISGAIIGCVDSFLGYSSED
jgi:hypothetical protein